MPVRPLRILDRAFRLTPSDRAASVTVRFMGSRHSCLRTSPGWGGLCIFIFTSVVILVIDANCILALPRKRHAPVAAHVYGPVAFSSSTKFVEFQAGKLHISHAGRSVQTAENQAKPIGVFRLNPRNRSGGEEPFESLVSKTLDRHTRKCNLAGYNLQSWRRGGRRSRMRGGIRPGSLTQTDLRDNKQLCGVE